MIVSACQPYFAPYPGFFSKALRSDILVLLDTVQFPRGTTWLTRNRFKNDQGTLWITLPVWKKGLGLQKIDRVRVCREGRWARKHLSGLMTAYRNAPFFEEHRGVLETLFTRPGERLVDINVEIIRYLAGHLGITAEIRLLSELGIEEKEPRLSVEICRRLGASGFLVRKSAGKYLDRAAFHKQGVALRYLTLRPPVYPQLWGPFIPNLSAFDLLFNCGPAAGRKLSEGVKVTP